MIYIKCYANNDCNSFILDGHNSKIMGVDGCHIVNINNSDDIMPWVGAQKVISNKIVGCDHPITIKTEKENLNFSLIFSLINDSFIPIMNHYLGKIFAKSIPVSLELAEDQTKMIYVIPTNQIEINRFGSNKGYFSIDFQATTPYWLTQLEMNNYILKSGEKFHIENKSNVQNSDGTYDIFPYIKFTVFSMDYIVSEQTRITSEKTEYMRTETNNNQIITEYSPSLLTNTISPTFELIHVSDNNRIIIFNDLEKDETIEMDSQLKQIKSSTGKNRFLNWNKEVFKLHEGYNEFQVRYPCKISMMIQYPIYQ